MTEEEKAEKKRKQHERWARWYFGPKGQAYRMRKKLERAGVEPEAKSLE
jgi:hypothetical protein